MLMSRMFKLKNGNVEERLKLGPYNKDLYRRDHSSHRRNFVGAVGGGW